MSLSDEEPPAISSSAGAGTKPFHGERVQLVAHHNTEAPLEQNIQQVLLEVIDTSSVVERSGLDLVAVLDISGSMGDHQKLEKMKTAMKFVIGKLGSMDRLSIVTFSGEAMKLCPLRCMTSASKEELTKGIVQLKASGSTNMEGGLRTGLAVLAGRRHRVGRVGSIILMSDGIQDTSSKAQNVDNMGDAAVYTFGFGVDNDAEVLALIANRSRGGTFYFVRDGESLSEHFSQLLAGLLSVVVQDLKLTVWEQYRHSEIEKVDAGGYLPPDAAPQRSVTMSFGDLYGGEMRKVLVHLRLPPVGRQYRGTILLAKCRYSIKGEAFEWPPRRGENFSCVIRRTGSARPDVVKPEVRDELIRLYYVHKIWEAMWCLNLSIVTEKEHGSATAGAPEVDAARHKLEEAKMELDAEQSNSNRTITKILRDRELKLLLSLAFVGTLKEFIACLVTSWLSHYYQRFAARGDVRSVRIFETPAMPVLLDQATLFEKNPSKPPPSFEEDVNKLALPPPTRQPQPRIREDQEPRHELSGKWAWRAVILLCTVLAMALILACVAVFAVFLLYKPKMPYLVVSDASLGQLQYAQDGTIAYLQASITIVAENNNSKADASFSNVDLVLGFNGADVALLQAAPFVVPRRSSLPLRYNVVSQGQTLDPAGMQAMDEALKAGVVPLDLFGKARTRWKVGVFVNLKFWTRISCRLRFFFPGNSTVMTTDRQKCRSRSP